MFDFFFKRTTKTKVTLPVSTSQPEPISPVQPKQTALAQAALLESEEAAIEFILQCQFADARLQAAVAHMHSRAALERGLHAMRNTDRRVAKLLQSRLELISQQEIALQQAEKCIQHAHQLVETQQLVPNQVAELDRVWQQIVLDDAQLRSVFDQAHAILCRRLEAQILLQRAVIDDIATLRVLKEELHSHTPAEIGQILDRLAGTTAQYLASAEAASLPKHLLPELTQQYESARQRLLLLEQRNAALSIRQEMLEKWESTDVSLLEVDVLKREWRVLPQLAEEDEASSALTTRFDTLLQHIARYCLSQVPVVQGKKQEVDTDTPQRFSEVLDAMQKALEEGSLQMAAEHDRTLRSIDVKAARLSAGQKAQLTNARIELGRLQGWARWGGNVSREELMTVAEALPALSLPPVELAKKVGSLRERWKSLDISAGPASKEAWARFDAACTIAYAPAAEHFKILAQDRQNNLAKAQALIADIHAFAEASVGNTVDLDAVDWKNIASYCIKMKHEWQRIGTVDRREKKRLDVDFGAALDLLLTPLNTRRAVEIRQREALIAQVDDLNASERGVLDKLHHLQERWQEQAKSLPLERKDEQALWLRFRSACDGLFVRRNAVAEMMDTDRQKRLTEFDTLRSKLLLCQILERALANTHAPVSHGLAGWNAKWKALPALSPDIEAAMRVRFDAAMVTLQSGERHYVVQLEQNAAVLAHEVMHFEIMAGIASPSELARERLQLQVEVLQSALGAGQKPVMPEVRLQRLCALPALIDGALSARIAQLIIYVENMKISA
jgi:predicted secreted Zn-dependent protease